VKKKKYFRMNFIGPIPAVDAGNPLILPNARLRVKAKVSRPARVPTYMLQELTGKYVYQRAKAL